MGKYKTADHSDIKASFKKLIDFDGYVTSLSVKEDLRIQGFWATQAIVGIAVREIAEEQGNSWDFNGTYRTYHELDTQMSPTLVSKAGSTLTPVAPVKRAPAASAQDMTPITAPVAGDWECRSKNGIDLVYFRNILTNAQARYAFSIVSGHPYVDARCTKVK